MHFDKHGRQAHESTKRRARDLRVRLPFAYEDNIIGVINEEESDT